MECNRLRNKLAQNRLDTLDTSAQKKILRLTTRSELLQLQVDSLRRIFTQLEEFKSSLETKLIKAKGGTRCVYLACC